MEKIKKGLSQSVGDYVAFSEVQQETFKWLRAPTQQKADDMVKIKIDHAKCVKEKDKLCLELCAFSVFSYEETRGPKVVNAEGCTLCRACQVNCPGQAIEILV